MSEESKPVRKIKPPSASFLKSKEAMTPAGPSESTAEEAALLGAPSQEVAPPDDDLFVVPVTAEEPEPEPAPLPAPTAPVSEASAALPSSAPPADSSLDERLAAELRELRDIVTGSESLAYLRSRVARAVDEKQSDALTLVSFYRLVARSLAEQAEASRRDVDTARSRASKLELELAAAAVAQMSPEAVSAPRSAAAPRGPENTERVEKLEEELKASNEQREKLLVDFKNMRERTQKDLTIAEFRFKEKFFKDMLPVLDAFERAGQSVNESSSVTSVLEGFRLISGLLTDFTSAQGLKPVDTAGDFDPRVHEAVGEVENDEKFDHYVYDELSRGYMLGERLIRAAMVRISRNPGMPPPPPGAGLEE